MQQTIYNNVTKHLMKNLYLILFSVIIILSCDHKTEKSGTIISGRINQTESQTVYLNEINHFDNLNENYIIDSTSISENGEFIFKKHNLNSKLVSIATKDFKPFTYQIYSTAPQTYFFGNCEKFFTSIPTFYITNEESININWIETENIDSISSPDNSGALQVKLREFYLNSNKIDASNLDYDSKVNIKDNWKQMLKERDFDLKSIEDNNSSLNESFNNFIYSEIYLGHLNKFLSWYEEFYPENVELAINNPLSNSIYLEIFNEYNNHNWNSKSLEYYKFTERYVNHHMNIESKSFKNYYEPTEIKRNLADRVLERENRERYLELIDKRIKNVL
jgi:hypothetical protein